MRKRKKKTGPNEKRYIKARECDVSMARSKGFLPCDHNCKKCHACIEILDNGDRQHFSYRSNDLGGQDD